MTTQDPSARPPRSTEGRGGRGARGLALGLAALLVVAYPLVAALSASHAAFSGCWIGCGAEAQPVIGYVFAVLSAVLLAAPPAVGRTVARVRSTAGWAGAVLFVVLAVLGWVLFAQHPSNADFFVELGRAPLPA